MKYYTKKQVLEQESQLNLGINMCISTSASLRKSSPINPQVELCSFFTLTHLVICYMFWFMLFGRNITQRQRELLEEFIKEEQGDYEKRTASASS